MKLLRRPAFWLPVLAVLGVAVYLLIRARGPSVTTVHAERTNLEQHVVASGRVMAPAQVNVSTMIAGLVVAIGAAEGQHVKSGDLLVQIEAAEAQTQVAQAKAQVEQASARVEQLRRVGAIVANQGLNQAQTNFDRTQTDVDRLEKLAASGAVPTVQLDDARRALDIARAQKNTAEAQQLAATPFGADSRVALGALLQAQAQLAGANVRLAQLRITARQDGTVLTRSVELGDTVQPGRTILVLAVDGDEHLVFEPDERNLSRIDRGQKARASADAFPQDVFDSEVSYIAPSIDAQRGTVEVRLKVPNPPTFLRPDMTVSIDLAVASRTNVIVLPTEAVRGLAAPKPWVLAVEGGRAVRKEVVVGIRGEGSIEVVAGVDEGAEVIIPDGQLVAAGQRVRASARER
ncbi:efflux RND transporter periplasmic adaptor subunit [soil metagenome]